jgi:hypothetical protein
MDEGPINRAYLESLTTEYLIKLADSLGLDTHDNPGRLLLMEEILELSLHDEDPATAQGAEAEVSDSIEPVPLPKCYNITFIEVMIRDPLWAFVFWEIKASDKEILEIASNFGGYYLKVTPKENSKNPSQKEADSVFTVKVKPEDTAWYLGLSPDALGEINCEKHLHQRSEYKVELCASMGGMEISLAVSNPIMLPGLPELPSKSIKKESPEFFGGKLDGNQLIRLSGYEDFKILRRNERQLRTKGFVV